MTTPTAERPPPNPELVLANWRNELDAAELYTFLAERETDPERRRVLQEMAHTELRHAEVMERGLRDLGIPLPRHRLSAQTRAMKLLARLFGNGIVYPLLHGMEIAGTAEYAGQDQATAELAPDERSHARVLGALAAVQGPGERWHRTGGGGTLRAAVFGVNDGLVSNMSLIMGFAGASADADVILLAGLAGLLAGASSMAAGEYVSMRAQRELFERQIELESAELAVTPDQELEELALIYRAKGVPRQEAVSLARRLLEDKGVALDTLVREELGLDPRELGSPWGAAIGSFLAFAIGAFLPVIPFFFGASTPLVLVSIGIAGLALFGVGASLSIFTGRSALLSGLRQLLIGGVAAALTFALGKVIGVSTAV
ncbi:MAG TPA: VIT1/CCC1 family protein [Dehalococcoidia bacterium]|nr:VIT1/CCC1 family protein [Dehalococcoidia bacterium]